MIKLPRKWIEDRMNASQCVQVACTYSNLCRWQYLTTSGKVCREEFNFVEDSDPDIEYATYDLPIMTWSSVKRLQRALENLHH